MLNDAGDSIACSERVRTARDRYTGLEARPSTRYPRTACIVTISVGTRIV
jgi:hypothetical protein